MIFSHCPNCNTAIKSGTFTKVELLNPLITEMVNYFREDKKAAHCTKCPLELFQKTEKYFKEAKKYLQEQIDTALGLIPVITINNPHKWEYEILDLVTAQYIVGTGGLTEMKAGISDVFGMRSETYRKKLHEGENICKNEIRSACLSAGGNAIIGVNVSYSEIGGDKGMLIVCMIGTAVKWHNTDSIIKSKNALNDLLSTFEQLVTLKRFDAVRFS